MNFQRTLLHSVM